MDVSHSPCTRVWAWNGPAVCRRSEEEDEMLRATLRSALFLWISMQAWESAQAGQFLVVTRTASRWSLQAIDTVTVNGKEKIRGTGSPAGNAATWDSKSIGKLAEEQLSSFVV